jgi:outer membrane protein assembly factor BamE
LPPVLLRRANRYNGPMISPYFSRRLVSFLRPWFSALAVLAAALALSACETTNNLSNRMAGIVTPYKIDVVQGNFVSKEQAAALKPGMSRLQVRDLLGTPLLMSMFHGDRWDYVFTFKRRGVEPQSRRVTVHFKGDLLERFEAGELPTEAEFVASLDSGRSSGKVPVLEASEESLAKFGAANKAPTPAESIAGPVLAPPPPLPERYPPLESSGR